MPDAIALDESSPEKAGVGGSSPSLATTFSIAYSYPLPSFCSILFQFQFRLAGICLNSEWIRPGPARPRYFDRHQSHQREARYSSLEVLAEGDTHHLVPRVKITCVSGLRAAI